MPECPTCGKFLDTEMGLSHHHARIHPEDWKDRFWYYVECGGDDECWEWNGTVIGNGYGQFRHLGESYYPHRLAYRITYTVAPKPQINHHCDNPLCVNPQHLYSGTQSENMQDAYERNEEFREHTDNLEGILFTSENANDVKPTAFDQPGHKFSKKEVKRIRRAVEEGIMQKDIEEYYDVSTATISRMINRKSYKNVK